MMYGLLEFASDADREPKIFVGRSFIDIRRAALEYLEELEGDEIDVPYPDMRSPEAIRRWWEEMWDTATAPMLTLYDEGEVIRA